MIPSKVDSEFLEPGNSTTSIKLVLPDFFEKDDWEIEALGVAVPSYRSSHKYFCFGAFNKIFLKDLVKHTFVLEIARNAPFSTLHNKMWGLRKFSAFLDEEYPSLSSILEIDGTLILAYIDFVNTHYRGNARTDEGRRISHIRRFFMALDELGYPVQDSVLEALNLRNPKTNLVKKLPYKQLVLGPDVWDVRELGIRINSHKPTSYKLNFADLSQPWLKELAKEFVSCHANSMGYKAFTSILSVLNKLSRFLREKYPYLEGISSITREIALEFIAYSAAMRRSGSSDKRIADGQKRLTMSNLNTFYRVLYTNGLANVPPVIYLRGDYPKRHRPKPRWIPEIVISQFHQHIDDLPSHIMRAYLVNLECGLRIGELSTLSMACLSQDKQGDWFLRFVREKTFEEDLIPISREIVAVIQEQQEDTKNLFGDNHPYLFYTFTYGYKPVPKPLSVESFCHHLNKVAEKYQICDENGVLWHFQSHQFRHTVGTKMINSGVPLTVIQRYLGHKSPEMTLTYARIQDETLKKNVQDFHRKVVNISGETVQEVDGEGANTGHAQWMKRNVLAQALSNGSCARPVVKGPCPHANACLTCGDFRTTLEFLEQHKAQLKATQELIDVAKRNGWQRQVEMNEQVAHNLQNIISELEKEDA